MQEPIRILHVLTAMNMAGTETLLMNFYRNVNRSKVQFDFAVSATEKCDYDDEIISLGGRIIHYPRYRLSCDGKYRKWWNNFFSAHSEYHIVHGHIGSTAAIYLKIAKRYGCFTIAHSHSIKSKISVKSIAYQIYAYPTRFIANQFFGCSRQALIDRYGKKVAKSPNARIVNNAIDSEKYIFNFEMREKIRKEYKIDRQQLVIGTVGRLSPLKNPYEIIRICETLKKRGLKFKFLWFGTGELKEDIEKTINTKKLNDEISLMGTRRDIYNVLQAFDIFLFPSVNEGLGIACIEAQAAGLPTFCSDSIPLEAKVTEYCKFLPLNKTKIWCDEIEKKVIMIKEECYTRPNTYKEIVNAGYDIKDVAGWLQAFYLTIEEEKR